MLIEFGIAGQVDAFSTDLQGCSGIVR